MKAYKGFNKDMTCRGFRFEEGKEYHEENASLCESGFHACENPLDCYNYYGVANSVFHEVEIDDLDERRGKDSKVCGKTIKIGARLSVAKICEAHFEYVKSHTTHKVKAGDAEGASAGASGSASAGAYGSASAGASGSVLVIAEENNNDYAIKEWKAVVVDGKNVKADTWYKLENGELVEVAP